jgi:hypothetical protein
MESNERSEVDCKNKVEKRLPRSIFQIKDNKEELRKGGIDVTHPHFSESYRIDLTLVQAAVLPPKE